MEPGPYFSDHFALIVKPGELKSDLWSFLSVDKDIRGYGKVRSFIGRVDAFANGKGFAGHRKLA